MIVQDSSSEDYGVQWVRYYCGYSTGRQNDVGTRPVDSTLVTAMKFSEASQVKVVSLTSVSWLCDELSPGLFACFAGCRRRRLRMFVFGTSRILKVCGARLTGQEIIASSPIQII